MTTQPSAVPTSVVPVDVTRRWFPGWRWAAVALAFPIAGLVGWAVGGHVDSAGPAVLGGAITAAGLGAVQWWAGNGTFGSAAAWISASAAGYALGLASGAALVGYDTDVASLMLMGLVSGAGLGAAQALTLARQGRASFGVTWGLAMPPLFAVGWLASSGIGVSVEDQFTVFGAAGALVFTVGSGVLLARLADPSPD